MPPAPAPRALRLLLLAGLALTLAPAARAMPFELRFEGTVGFLDPLLAPTLAPGVSLDDPISVVLTFDADAPDANPDPARATYMASGAPFGVVVQIGSLTLVSGPDVFVTILDDFPLPGFNETDFYSVSGLLETPSAGSVVSFQVSGTVLSTQGDPLSSDGLPTTPQALSGFPQLGFTYQKQNPGPGPIPPAPDTVVSGFVAVVPEPGTLALLLAIGAMGCRARAALSHRGPRP